MDFSSPVALFAPGVSGRVAVDVVASRADVSGTLRLVAPAGWRVSPAGRPFKLASVGERQEVAFSDDNGARWHKYGAEGLHEVPPDFTLLAGLAVKHRTVPLPG